MNKLRTIVFLCCLTSGAAATQAQTAHRAIADAEISHLVERWRATFRHGDTTTMWSMLDHSIALYGVGNPRTDTDSVRAWLRRQAAIDTLLLLSTQYEHVESNQAISMGRWTLYQRGPNNRWTGVHTIVFDRDKDGSWKIHTLVIIPNPPATSTPSNR